MIKANVHTVLFRKAKSTRYYDDNDALMKDPMRLIAVIGFNNEDMVGVLVSEIDLKTVKTYQLHLDMNNGDFTMGEKVAIFGPEDFNYLWVDPEWQASDKRFIADLAHYDYRRYTKFDLCYVISCMADGDMLEKPMRETQLDTSLPKAEEFQRFFGKIFAKNKKSVT